MTTLWADSFQEYTTATFGEYVATSGFACDITSGRRTGGGAFVTVSNGGGNYLRRTLGSSPSTLFQSVAFKPLAIGGLRTLLSFMEGATNHIQICCDVVGKVSVYRGSQATLLGTSASAFFAPGTFGFIQAKVVIHDTTGSVEIRDGSNNVLLNLTGIDTRNGQTGICDTAQVGDINNMGASYVFSDWHVWDAVGSVCNTFTGDTRIDSKFPDGAGDLAQFTPSTGSNYAAVDESPPNTTDYVDSATAGQQDLYAFANISHSPPSIFSVLRVNVATKDDAGARSLKPLTKRGATVYSGTAVGLTQGSYVRQTDVQETDPSTSAAWTQTNLNAAQFGFESV